MEQPVASTSQISSRLGECASLDCTRPALYRCPACSFPSCSLACSTSHKLAISCTGIAPPIWSKHITAREWGWGTLMRDQSYISGVGRLAEETGKNLVGAGLIPKGRNGGENGVLDDRSEKEDKLVSVARSAGVNLVLLPKGMSRRSKNASRWDLKEQRMEWTTEIIFQPPPPPTTISEPFRLTLAIPSSSTLQTILSLAMESRDKKGKGKATEDETNWSKTERDWLNSLTTSSASKEGESTNDEVSTELKVTTLPLIKDIDSPYLFLLVAASIPTFTSHNEDSDLEDSPIPLPISISSKPAKPPAKTYYHPSIESTLSSSLQGITLLEYPTFELWPRESYLRALAKAQIKILPKPEPLTALSSGSGGWDRGRVRGRGREGSNRGTRGSRGGGRGGGGNGRGGSHSGNSNGWKDEVIEGERIQDSGWGNKRKITEVEEGESAREEKRERPQEIEIEIEVSSSNYSAGTAGDVGLVEYGSE